MRLPSFSIVSAKRCASVIAVFLGAEQPMLPVIPASAICVSDSARDIRSAEKEIEMCWVVQGYINEGKMLGLEQGKQEEAALNAKMLFKNGASMELVAASIQSLTAEKLQQIYGEVQAEKA